MLIMRLVHPVIRQGADLAKAVREYGLYPWSISWTLVHVVLVRFNYQGYTNFIVSVCSARGRLFTGWLID